MFGFLKRPRSQGLGLELKPGDEHYRAYIGPPRDYDLVAAMVFNLLTCAGLRQGHRLLDIGCGSLRLGRLFIPYLNPGNYVGVEPNRWLVEDGIANEVGRDQIRLKRPVFSYRDSLEEFPEPLEADYAVAQSIFSHCGLDLIDSWLAQVSRHLKPSGALFATFLVADRDFEGLGWVYPDCVNLRVDTLANVAAKYGLKLTLLDWKHPRQSWGLFAREQYDYTVVRDGGLSWNRLFDKR
jgi:cyclopropane fatty-acyl-phospholipid synthase-like methyltransferase